MLELSNLDTGPCLPPGVESSITRQIGDVSAIWIESTERTVHYDPNDPNERLIGDHVLKLYMQLSGTSAVSQERERSVIPEGLYTWLRTDRAFSVHLGPDSRFFSLLVPKERLRQRFPNADVRPATVRGADHRGERVLRSLLYSLGQEGCLLSDDEAILAVGALIETLGLGPRVSTAVADERRVERALLEIEHRLTDPELTAESVACAQGVSRRYLDEVLQRRIQTTLAQHIRQRRLERAADDLRSSRHRERSILEIAMRWGFHSAAHFSRIFSQHFGQAPSIWRRGAL